MSRPLGSSTELERRRCRAVDLIHKGERPSVVARILGVHRTSIYRWCKQAQANPENLRAKPHPHRPPRLNDQQLRELEKLLLQGAQTHGWNNQLWTAARVAVVIHRHFGIGFHHDYVGYFLRERLGWTSQKPVRRARERNEQAILRWQSEEFPQLAKDAFARGAHLVFLDESGFMLTPTVRRTWSPAGQTPMVDAWDRRDRISAISSISVSPVARRLNLHFALMSDNHNVNAEDIVEYLRQLRATLGGPLSILWDGSRIHDRSLLVRAYLAEHPEIQTHRIPAYAPELNPDELVWAWTKYSRLGNLAAENTDCLRDYIQTELNYIKRHPELLASFIDKVDLPVNL